MCGINGILKIVSHNNPVDPAELRSSRDFMSSRGPDGVGEWFSTDYSIGLGHRRLAIIDLSSDGSQPMSWDDGRYQIVFNGEIYNYRSLREELISRGIRFRSNSDTEVILALFSQDGLNMLTKLRGMFAFAIWDNREQTLTLGRDPYGIKPLYYSLEGGYFRFASQVKALEVAGISKDIEPAALVGFLLWGSVPEPLTIRRSILAVPAGHYLIVNNGQVSEPTRYYTFGSLDCAQVSDPIDALHETVKAHLVADVPTAIFLSGGLDSTLITALSTRYSDKLLTTFTLKFPEFENTPLDEAPFAREISSALGTNHIEYRVERSRFRDLWSSAIAAMDQPSVDGFNTFLISKAAHEHGLKVVLSGLGGDELMGSYPSFRDVPSWYNRLRWIAKIPLADNVCRIAAKYLVPHQPKASGLIRYGNSFVGTYYLRRGLFLPEELPALIGDDLAREGLAKYQPAKYIEPELTGFDNDWVKVHILESIQYMRNQLLRDVDWASMAHSIELRVPLVDAWLREQFYRFKFDPARSLGKASIIRQAVPQLPLNIFDRSKTGFYIPVGTWMDENKLNSPVNIRQESRKLTYHILREFALVN